MKKTKRAVPSLVIELHTKDGMMRLSVDLLDAEAKSAEQLIVRLCQPRDIESNRFVEAVKVP